MDGEIPSYEPPIEKEATEDTGDKPPALEKSLSWFKEQERQYGKRGLAEVMGAEFHEMKYWMANISRDQRGRANGAYQLAKHNLDAIKLLLPQIKHDPQLRRIYQETIQKCAERKYLQKVVRSPNMSENEKKKKLERLAYLDRNLHHYWGKQTAA